MVHYTLCNQFTQREALTRTRNVVNWIVCQKKVGHFENKVLHGQSFLVEFSNDHIEPLMEDLKLKYLCFLAADSTGYKWSLKASHQRVIRGANRITR